MFKGITGLCLTFLLAGCGTMQFTPVEYPLRDGLIPAFDVTGTAQITNDQPSTSPAVVYSYGGTVLSSDLKSITETMVQQARKELIKNGHRKGGAASKSIALKVNSLLSTYAFFYWNSEIQFQATLGDGKVIDFKVPHTSGSALQDLDGCIADGVMTLLKDERIEAYLAS